MREEKISRAKGQAGKAGIESKRKKTSDLGVGKPYLSSRASERMSERSGEIPKKKTKKQVQRTTQYGVELYI